MKVKIDQYDPLIYNVREADPDDTDAIEMTPEDWHDYNEVIRRYLDWQERIRKMLGY